MMSDLDIMLRVQAGETDLFGELVRRYRTRLTLFAASKLRRDDLAEEVVQETFLAAYRARDGYSPKFAFSTWIWTILLNLTKSVGRKEERHRRGRVEALPEFLEERNDSGAPATRLLAEERRDRIIRILDRLPEFEADAIRLKFFGGLKYEEIALAMDSSVSGAKVRVRRGLERLARIAWDESAESCEP